MITPGNKMPAVQVKLVTAEGTSDVTSDTACSGARTVLFTLPGAFTPTCQNRHLPGYIENADKLKAAGAIKIICASVNDHHVMRAWAESLGAFRHLEFMADGNGELAAALDLETDMSAGGMGTRFARAAMIIENGTITHAARETERGVVSVSGAEAILKTLTLVEV